MIKLAVQRGSPQGRELKKYDPYSLRFKRKYLPPEHDYSTFIFLGEVVKDKTDFSGNTFWIGSWAAGLFKWNRETGDFKLFDMKDGLLSHEVFHVVQSRFGYLIIDSVYGITLFDPHWDLPGVIPQKGPFLIGSVHEDKQHRIWVGGFNGNIQIITPATGQVRNITNEARKELKLPRIVHRLYLDEKKEPWVNGQGNYLAQLDDQGEVKRIF